MKKITFLAIALIPIMAFGCNNSNTENTNTLEIVSIIGGVVNATLVTVFTVICGIYQINNYKTEKADKKKAELFIIDIPGYISIVNKGKSTAKNIRAEIINTEHNLLGFDPSKLKDIELSPGESVELYTLYASQISKAPIIKVTWDDLYASNRDIIKKM